MKHASLTPQYLGHRAALEWLGTLSGTLEQTAETVVQDLKQ